ncbi:MAG: glycosyltransferase family 9 protein [Gammaproteobacteria bacterium]
MAQNPVVTFHSDKISGSATADFAYQGATFGPNPGIETDNLRFRNRVSIVQDAPMFKEFFRRIHAKLKLASISSPESICILRLSAIGDVCHTVAVVRTLQSHWPDTKLTWVIGKTEASLVGDIPGIEFIIFDKSRGWHAYRDLRRCMRGREFDILLQMHASLRASLASLFIPAPIKLGFDKARAVNCQWLFTTHRINGDARVHAMDGLFQFLEAIGINERILRWDIPLSDADRGFAARNVESGRSILVISACSSRRWRNYRNWSAENYAAVADYAAERYGMQVILTGGETPLEVDYGQRICQLTRCKPHNLVGQTTLKQLLAVLERSTVLVCPDSGPAHMATTVNKPVIGLYATANPARTGPYLSQKWVVNKYPQAVLSEFGRSVNEIRWGRRVRDPEAVNLPKVSDVTAKLDQIRSGQ